MRITIELIQRSPQYVNPLGEREICFRGLKIPLIENLGATLVRPIQDQYEVIDLTNNELTRLEETAPLRHLTTFLLANNHISKISPDFGKELPYLENLILTNNKVQAK
jgi:U2 small nuclear ribonucleoprotein A'